MNETYFLIEIFVPRKARMQDTCNWMNERFSMNSWAFINSWHPYHAQVVVLLFPR